MSNFFSVDFKNVSVKHKKWPIFIFSVKAISGERKAERKGKTGAGKGGPVCIAEMSDVKTPGLSL